MAYDNPTGLPSVTEIIRPYIDTEWFTPEHTERGSAVHAAAAAHIQGLYVIPIKAEWQGYFDSFRRWVDMVRPEPVLIEERLVDRTLGDCGKPDLIAKLPGQELPDLIDWKTSQAEAPWWRLQACRYRELAWVDRGITTGRGYSVRLKKDGSGALLPKRDYPATDTYARNIYMGLLNAHKFFQ